MHEATQQLLDGVVGLTCVDPSLHPLISAAPLVGSIIAQQSVYVCHVASASHALLGQGDSVYWHVLRGVAAARERYVASRAPVGPNLAIPSRRNPSATSPVPPEIFSHLPRPMGSGTSAPKSAVPPLPEPPGDVPLLSPLEFRVVVVGGGRVGRQIVERLLHEPTLVHPSRITIITRQPNTVADFASRGVLCTGRTEGREALEACHVLIIACQQSQFYDFATIYCPRVHKPKRTPRAAEAAASQRAPSATPSPNGNASRKSEFSRRRRRRRRTLRDVVNKWRAALDDDSDENDDSDRDESVQRRKGHSGAPRCTALLSPGTIVFSCCVALGPHKIAKEIGHLDPLVVRADVDLRAVHVAAAQFRSAQDAHRDAYVRRVALEDNTFLTMLHSVQRSSPLLMSSPVPTSSSGIDFGRGFGSASGSGGAMSRLAQGLLSSAARAPPDMQCALSGDGVSGGTLLLLQVWRALRCIAVVREASLALAQQRTFTYLQRVGPLLGAALVALPRECQCDVLAALTKELARCDEDSDEDGEKSKRDSEALRGGRPLFALERRVVSAYDSDDNGDSHDRSPPHSRELARLVECFPEVFSTEEAALQQLREYYTTVTTPSAPKVV